MLGFKNPILPPGPAAYWRDPACSICLAFAKVGHGESLSPLRADGSFRNLLARLSRIDVLVIDDWAMAPLAEPERRDFGEICEDRYQARSTLWVRAFPTFASTARSRCSG